MYAVRINATKQTNTIESKVCNTKEETTTSQIKAMTPEKTQNRK